MAMRSVLLAGDRFAAITEPGGAERAQPTRMALTRRAALASGGAGIAGLTAPSMVRAEASRTLRFIPTADLLSLDPMWTTADSARNHGNMVYDQLYGLDAGFTPHPQMVAGHRTEDDGLTWDLTLRDGPRFHDGVPVLARDCVASIVRWGRRDPYGTALMARTAEIAAASDRVIRFRLKRPFASLPEALAQPTCVMMPERVAKTDPFTEITDPTGSGPFRFVPDERLPGVRSVYTRFEGYIPRPDGKASFLAGPRVVHFDRAVWTVLPDAGTAAAALTNGEFDWWEAPPFDLVGMLRAHRDIRVEVKNKVGFIGCMRFNHLQKPFDKVAIRRLVLACVNQSEFMQAVAGAEPELFRTKVGLFALGTPMANEAGIEALMERTDFDQVRKDLTAAGYGGEKVVLLGFANNVNGKAQAEVADDLLRRMGFDVDYQSLDFGTVLQRRTNKGPPEKGGWHIFITGLPVLQNVLVPASNVIRSGPAAWFGWPDVPRLETLREEWLNAPSPEEQRRLAAAIQTQVLRDVTHVPLGQFIPPTAFNRRLVDIQPGFPVMHGVRWEA